MGSEGFELVEPDAWVFDELVAHFDSDNPRHTSWDRTTFSLIRRSPTGAIEAGGQAILNMGLAELRVVWISPTLRGRGIGRALIGALEAEARRRGASKASLDTYSWQAEGFYIKLGYRVWGRLAYPNGTERIYLAKPL